MEKLVDPVTEIRQRALENLWQKVNLGLVDLNLNVLLKENQLLDRLLEWFSQSWVNIANRTFWLLLTRVLETISECQDEQCKESLCRTSDVLNDWKRSQSFDVSQYGDVKRVQNILEDKTEIQPSNISSTFSEEEAPSLASSTKVSFSTISSFQLPKVFPFKVPERFLSAKTPDSYSESWSKTPAPTPVQYFRKVRFEDFNLEENCRVPDAKLPTVEIDQKDKLKVDSCINLLKNGDADEKHSALEEFSYSLLQHIQPQYFLHNPDVFQHTLECFLFSSYGENRVSAIEALSLFSKKLKGALIFHIDNSPETLGPSSAVSRDHSQNQSSQDSLSNDASFNAISLLDFIILILSSVSSSITSIRHLCLLEKASILVKTVSEMAELLSVKGIWKYQTRKTCVIQGIIRDILQDFCKAVKEEETLVFHNPSVERRAQTLLLIQTCVHLLNSLVHEDYYKLFIDTTELLLFDPTLYLSHSSLWEACLSVCPFSLKDDFDNLKNLLRKLTGTLAFLTNQSKNMVRDAIWTLELQRLHQNPVSIRKFIDFFKDSSVEDVAKKNVALSLLNSFDPNFATEAVLGIHNLVQDALGIQQALKVGKSALDEVSFLFHDNEILELLAFNGICEKLDKTVAKASKEIILYFLKNRHERRRLDEVMQYLMPVLELYISQQSSPIGNIVKSYLDPEQGNDQTSKLKSSMRMLYHSSKLSRQKGSVILKSVLVKDKELELCIPRMEQVLQADIVDSFENVEIAPCLLETRWEFSEANTIDIVTKLESASCGESDAYSWLKTLVQSSRSACAKFLELQGMQMVMANFQNLFKGQWDGERHKILEDLLGILKGVCVFFPYKLPISEELIIYLSRSIFFMNSLAEEAKQDLAIVSFLHLFTEFVSINDVQELIVNKSLQNRHLKIPVTFKSQEVNQPYKAISLADSKYLGVLKQFWHLNVSRLNSQDLLGGLKLTEVEEKLFHCSFPDLVVQEEVASLISAQDHKSFKLRLARISVFLRFAETDALDSASILKLQKCIQRFFTKTPKSKDDRDLMVHVLKFVQAHRSKFFEEWITKYGRNWKIMDIIQEESSTTNRLKLFFQVREYFQVVRPFSLLRQDHDHPFLPGEEMALLVVASTASEADLGHYSLEALLEAVETLSRLSQSRKVKAEIATSVTMAMRNLSAVIHELGQISLIPSSIISQFGAKWTHSSPYIRILSLEAFSKISSTPEGAKLVFSLEPWQTLSSILKDSEQPFAVSIYAAEILKNLVLVSSENDPDCWLGPTMVEPISGLKITGSGALQLHANAFGFEDLLKDLLKRNTTSEKGIQLLVQIIELEMSILLIAPETSKDSVNVATSLLKNLAESQPNVRLLRDTFDLVTFLIEYAEIHPDQFQVGTIKNAFVAADNLFNDYQGEESVEIFELFHSFSNILAVLLNFSPEGLKTFSIQNTLLHFTTRLLSNFAKLKNTESAIELLCILLFSVCHWNSACDSSLRKKIKAAFSSGDDPLGRKLAIKVMCYVDKQGTFDDDKMNAIASLTCLFQLSFYAQDEALKRDIIPVCEKWVKEATNKLINTTLEAQRKDLLVILQQVLQLLNNLCHENLVAKDSVAHSSILASLQKGSAIFQMHMNHPANYALLEFLITGSIDCESFRQSIVRNRSSDSGKTTKVPAFKKFNSLLTFILELARKVQKLPRVKELVLVMTLNAEARKVLYRSLFFEELTNLKDSKAHRVFLMDILVSMTSFHDGQVQAMEPRLLQDFLLPTAAGAKSLNERRSAFAVIRNLAFLSRNASRLLNIPEFLQLVSAGLRSPDEVIINLAIHCVLSIATQCNKAIKMFEKSGISSEMLKIRQDHIDPDVLVATKNALKVQTILS